MQQNHHGPLLSILYLSAGVPQNARLRNNSSLPCIQPQQSIRGHGGHDTYLARGRSIALAVPIQAIPDKQIPNSITGQQEGTSLQFVVSTAFKNGGK
jgi:hypothetical protein